MEDYPLQSHWDEESDPHVPSLYTPLIYHLRKYNIAKLKYGCI